MTSHPSTSPHHYPSLRNYGPPRTSGIHYSSIVRHVALITGELKKEYGDGPPMSEVINTTTDLATISTSRQIMMAAVGFMWEKWMASQIHNLNPNFNHQPGELKWDGVIATPDGIEEVVDTEQWGKYTVQSGGPRYVIHEFKATWKSSAYPVTDNMLWMWQAMGHCYMLGKELDQPVLTAVIHPLYIKGNYRDLWWSTCAPTVVEFDEDELERNWNMMMQYKDCVMPEVW